MDKFLEKQMKTKRNPIANAIKIALYSGLIASVAFTNVAVAQDDDESVEKLEKTVVTGSRIKRSEIEGAVPVTVITREDIELSGQTNVADLLRSTTFNSAGSIRPQSGSSAQGVSSVGLRGIGASRTLILIDGRRLPKSPSTGSSQDLNTIPLGMVERIEILSDGASAIYGSDAIGGVINVITRTDFTGVQITLGGAEVSTPTNGGERSNGHVLFGAANDTSNIIAGVSWNDREIVFARDFPWVTPGVSSFGNNFRRVNDTGGETGPLIGIADGLCEYPDRAYYILGDICSFDFSSVSADEASTENKSLFLKAKHEINDNWQVWANAGFYQTSSFGRYAPVPDGSRFGVGIPLTVNSINNPSNPASPNYDPVNFPTQEEIHWRHRFDALGNRDSTVTNNRTSFELGFTGQILDNVEVEFGVTRTNNRTSEIGRNYLLRSAAAAAIESGTYLLSSPYTTDSDVLNGMRVTTSREGVYDQDEYFASASFDVFEMTHGAVGVFVGAEFRDIKYADIYDSLSEAGQVGGSAGNSAAGTRDVTAVFFETLFPLLENLEMNIAGRFDDYSDYGNDFSPKISFRYQPLDNLTLRASYGEGFRAPTLDILTQQDSFSADSIRDRASCVALGAPADCNLQIDGTVTANPSLQSEQSEQFSLGVAYEPVEWFNGTLDYFNIKVDNRIRQFTAQDLVNNLRAGDPNPPGLGCVTDPVTGAIDSCIRGFGNEGLIEVSGLDLNLRFNYEALGGHLRHQLQWSHLLKTSLDGGRDLINDPGSPADRMVVNSLYSYGDWSFAYNLNLIGDQYDRVQVLDSADGDDATTIAALADPVEVTSLGGTVARYRSGHVPTWVTHDIQLNYHAPWDGRITLGVNNVGEKAPPIGVGFLQQRDYDFRLYDGFGRVTYLRYTQTF